MGHFGKTAGSLLVILAKQSGFLEPFLKKAGTGGSSISQKKKKVENGGYLNKSDNRILFLNLDLTSFQRA